MLNTSEKVKVDPDLVLKNKQVEKLAESMEEQTSQPLPKRAFCRLCRGIKDDYNILECGFDKDLIGSDPQKLMTSYLQASYESQLQDYELQICFTCRKVLANASDKQLLIDFLKRMETA